MKSRVIIIFCLLMPGFPLLAQQTTTHMYRYRVGLESMGGFILKHSPESSHLAVSHPSGTMIYWQRLAQGTTHYQRALNNPALGVSLGYLNYHNPVLGRSFIVIPHIQIPLLSLAKSRIDFMLGTGIAYHTNPHDLTNNNSNTALGTPLTFAIQSALSYHYLINTEWELKSSLSLAHLSNGAYSQPNLGLNIPTISLGAARKLQPLKNTNPDRVTVESPLPENYYTIWLKYGVRTLEYGGEIIPFANLTVMSTHKFTQLNAVSLGADLFFKFPPWSAHQYSDVRDSPLNVGIAMGHEFQYYRVSLVTQMGAYVHRSFDNRKPPFYQRYGLNFAWTKALSTGITLKAHGGQAEFIEWAMGLRF